MTPLENTAAAMKQTTDVSNRWLSERLAMGQPASASQFVRRFLAGGGEKDQKYLRIMSRVAT